MGEENKAGSEWVAGTFRLKTNTSCFSLFTNTSTKVRPTAPVPPATATLPICNDRDIEIELRSLLWVSVVPRFRRSVMINIHRAGGLEDKSVRGASASQQKVSRALRMMARQRGDARRT